MRRLWPTLSKALEKSIISTSVCLPEAKLLITSSINTIIHRTFCCRFSHTISLRILCRGRHMHSGKYRKAFQMLYTLIFSLSYQTLIRKNDNVSTIIYCQFFFSKNTRQHFFPGNTFSLLISETTIFSLLTHRIKYIEITQKSQVCPLVNRVISISVSLNLLVIPFNICLSLVVVSLIIQLRRSFFSTI